MKLVILAALAAIASPALAADQFDLVCKGVNKATSVAPEKPIVKHYRVDIASKRWCQDECIGIDTIAEIAEDTIKFRYQPQKYERDTLIIEEVDRVSGAWKDVIFGAPRNGTYWNSRGLCEVAAFSGFPPPKTKF